VNRFYLDKSFRSSNNDAAPVTAASSIAEKGMFFSAVMGKRLRLRVVFVATRGVALIVPWEV